MEAAIDLLITEEEMRQGFKLVEAETQQAGEIVVRMNVPEPYMRQRLFDIFAATRDEAELVRALLAEEYQRDTFLEQLTPAGLTWLANVAVGICVGPDGIRKVLSQESGRN